MSTAILYAGQGAQHAGMGQDLYGKYEAFRSAFDAAELDFDLHRMCFEDPDGLLVQTQYTQPAMTAFACGVTAILKENGVHADVVAGLSLGEYSALEAAGAMDARTAIEMTAFRGAAMAEAAGGIDCAMTAVLNLSEEKLQDCCHRALHKGIVSICNYNCPGQLVIGGERAAVEEAARLAAEAGARRCVPLKVSGPFHTSLMRPAGDALREYFTHIQFQPLQTKVMFNVLGGPNDTGASIPYLLERQVQSPVRMEASLRRMLDDGVRNYIEVGPGKTLTGFVKKTAKAMGIEDITTCALETVEDIEGFLQQ